ncbi:MAG: hypothetical protein HY751_07215 [Nitrospinae bacterium]|nr:hypothetical protein [Nitrospinota bacterium]
MSIGEAEMEVRRSGGRRLFAGVFQLRYLALFILPITLPSCAWTAEERGLFSSYLAFSAIDAWQTDKGAKAGLEELNPIYKNQDGVADIRKVLAMKIGGAALIALLLDQAREDRRELLYAANGIQGGVVVWNSYALEEVEKLHNHQAGFDDFGASLSCYKARENAPVLPESLGIHILSRPIARPYLQTNFH